MVDRSTVLGFIAGGALASVCFALLARRQGRASGASSKQGRAAEDDVSSSDEGSCEESGGQSPEGMDGHKLTLPPTLTNASSLDPGKLLSPGAGFARDATASAPVGRGRRKSVITDSLTYGVGRTRRIKGAESLRMVVVVLRHGARLPNNPLPHDICWPISPDFYKKYKGTLSPQGVLQQIHVGNQLREKYVLGSGLFDGFTGLDVGSHDKVFTSNFQRTIFTAWSVLYGWFPGVPCSFNLAHERLDLDLGKVREAYNEEKMAMGVPIFVQESEADVLIRQWKRDPKYKKWKKDNVSSSPQMKAWAESAEVKALVDKVYIMTGIPKLHPDESMKSRLFKVTSAVTQIKIAEAHNLIPLANRQGLKLTPRERELLFAIANFAWKHWFTKHDSSRVEDSPGRSAAGMLLHEIWRHMDLRVRGKSESRAVVYSAHDSTLLAMQSHMGVEVTKPPAFAAHYVFELHESKERGWHVKFLYNPNPEKVDEWQLQSRVMNNSGEFVAYDEMPLGSTAFSAFEEQFKLSVVTLAQGIAFGRTHSDVLRTFFLRYVLPRVKESVRRRRGSESGDDEEDSASDADLEA